MSDKVEALKEALLDHFQREEPLMDTPSMRERIVEWLGNLPYPGDNDKGWEDCLTEFPSDSEEKKSDKGVKIRFALRLRTARNQYLMSILECLAPSARGNYILSVHVNWDEQERKQQKMLEDTYQDGFDDTLRARHTIWVQNFKEDEIEQALSAGAVAMLGQELIAEPLSDNQEMPVDLPYPGPMNLPTDSID
jgi:hypothetical protein